jgi:hypothetical protein
MSDFESRNYDGFTLMYVPDDAEDNDPEASGLYVKVHEVIALLRYEAILSEQGLSEQWERSGDCLNSVADAFAEQAVLAMEEFGEIGLDEV